MSVGAEVSVGVSVGIIDGTSEGETEASGLLTRTSEGPEDTAWKASVDKGELPGLPVHSSQRKRKVDRPAF